MPKRMKTKRRKITTFARAGKAVIRVTISLLIEGIELIDLRGLKALSILIGPKEGRLENTFSKNSSTSPSIATIKSIQFQPSLK